MPMYTFTTDDKFTPIIRLFIRKAKVERPRLIASFPNDRIMAYFKARLEKGRYELHAVWDHATP